MNPADQGILKPGSHAFQHLCWFNSCPFAACQKAQRDAARYGFRPDGEINLPSKPRQFPWEDAA